MLTIGLTGNAGSGKSTVAALWQRPGVVVLDADELAREIVDGDRALRQALAIEFGEEVLEPSAGADVGPLRRQELARRAFASPERTQALDTLVHPPLVALLEERLAEAAREQPDLVVVDAALIFELGFADRFDRMVLVTAPAAARAERLRLRGLDDETVARLMASQLPDEEKLPRAHYVVVNDGSLEELATAARDLLQSLLSLEVSRDGGSQALSRAPL
jgi:dephospho-CoA kinase